MFLATFFLIYFPSFQDRFSSSKTPSNFDFTLSILSFLIRNLGNKWGRSSLLLSLWKREYFVFPTLIESLFASNHSLIFCTSWLSRENKVFEYKKKNNKKNYYYWVIIESSTDDLWRSFTYNRKSSGPNIEPCRTPQQIFLVSV